MGTRVKIAEFGIIQKALALSVVTFYVADENGENSGVKAVLYQNETGPEARENPQTLDTDGKLAAECWVEAQIIAAITGITERTERAIRKIRQNPLEFSLPITSANYASQAAGDLYGDLAAVQQAVTDVQAVLTDPGFVVVSGDLLGPDNIGTVADNISSVNSVANNESNVNIVAADLDGANTIGTVAGDIDEVSAVGSNIAQVLTVAAADSAIATVAADLDGTNTIGTVAGSINDVQTVAAADAAIATVAADLDGDDHIGTVASSMTSVTTVAGSIASVNTVAGSIGNVNSVAANATNINAVAAITGQITTVAGISTAVSTVAGISTAVSNVSSISAAVSNVSSISGAVVAVANNGAAVSTVASNITNVNSVAAIDDEVSAVAAAIVPISIVASDLVGDDDIGTVAAGMTDISTVSAIGTQIVTVAGIASDVVDAANNIPKANRSATTDPDPATDDNTAGYSPGSMWVNVTSKQIFLCTDASTGSAVWENITAAAAASLASMTDVNFSSLASGDMMRYNGTVWQNRTATQTRTDLSLVVGTNVQAYHASLQSISGLTTLADRMIYTTASNTYAVTPLTAAARSVLDDTSVAAMATTLGLGTTSSPQFTAVNIGHATDTTLSRVSAGVAAIEGNNILTANLIGTSVQAYSAVLQATTASFTTADETKVDYLTVTAATNLDAIRTRVDALDSAIILKGSWDASTGSFPGGGTAQAGESWIVSADGTVGGVAFNANDRIIAIIDNASTSTFANNWFKADYTDQVLSVAGRTGAVTLAQADISGLTTASAPQFASVNVGHASDTTITRVSAGVIAVEGSNVVLASGAGTVYYNPGGTDVAVADGGTGRSSHTAYAVLCGGTTTTGAQQSIASVGTAGQVLTSNGAGALPSMQDVPVPSNVARVVHTQNVTTTTNAIEIGYTFQAGKNYRIVIESLRNSSGSTVERIELSSDNGVTWLTSAGAYRAQRNYAGTANSVGSATYAYAPMTENGQQGGVPNLERFLSAEIKLFDPVGQGYCDMTVHTRSVDDSGGVFSQSLFAVRTVAAFAANKLRLTSNGVRQASGRIVVWEEPA